MGEPQARTRRQTDVSALVIDIGGSKVKALATRQSEPRKFRSGSKLTPQRMVSGVRKITKDWQYDVIAIGYPGVARQNRVTREPRNLGKGWVDFDFAAAFDCPVKLINDAAMQALGSYQGRKLLFLGLGTGLGSAMVINGVVAPMELGYLSYKKSDYEGYVGDEALKKKGKKEWRRHVAEMVAHLTVALQPSDVVLGGGNVDQLKELPPGCRVGDNANAFVGGFLLWENERAEHRLSKTTSVEVASFQ